MEEIICKKCGVHAAADETFCGGCGAFLEWEGERGVVDDGPPIAAAVPAAPERPTQEKPVRKSPPRKGPPRRGPPPCLLPRQVRSQFNQRPRLSGPRPRPRVPRCAGPSRATYFAAGAASPTIRSVASAGDAVRSYPNRWSRSAFRGGNGFSGGRIRLELQPYRPRTVPSALSRAQAPRGGGTNGRQANQWGAPSAPSAPRPPAPAASPRPPAAPYAPPLRPVPSVRTPAGPSSPAPPAAGKSGWPGGSGHSRFCRRPVTQAHGVQLVHKCVSPAGAFVL